MKLIIGLGNPGKTYEKTRHNVGYMLCDFLKEKLCFEQWKHTQKLSAYIASGEINKEKILLIKPSVFMNESGETVRKIIDFYHLDVQDFLVVYDDKDMDFGKIRYRETGQSGGHNGIKNIIAHCKNNWKRIKIGIGYDAHYTTANWVLSKFQDEEIKYLESQVWEEVYSITQEKFL